MSTQKHSTLPLSWQRRLYLIGFLLCLLGLLGVGIRLLTPDDSPDYWAAHTRPLDDALTGDAGGAVRPAPSVPPTGESHNEGTQGLDAFLDAESQPATPTLALAGDPTDNVPLRPDPASGIGEITITTLMPGARVDVADYVVTRAPTTLRLPWPANYAVAVHVGEATVYETRLRLTADNNRLSIAIDPEIESIQ